MFDSLIFDIDGTLWDSTGTIAKSFSEASAEFEFGKKEFTRSQIRGEVGRPLDEIFLHLYPEIGERYKGDEAQSVLSRVNKISTEYEYDWLKKYGGDVFDGVPETLKYLSERIPVFIVSNCEKGYIEIMTEASGIRQYFTDWLCYGDTLKEKDITMSVLIDKHKLKKPAYAGDIRNDALSSRKAGVPFIWAAYGFGNVEKELYYGKINEFSEIKNFIE